MSKGEPMPYDDAMRIAKKHLIGMLMLPTVEKITIVGSLRRKSELVKDIDYQVLTTGRGMRKIEEYFWAKNWVSESIGKQRAVFTAKSGVSVNVFNSERRSWGAALMHNTGPSRYNIRKRMMIKKMGGVLNQYGLYLPNESSRHSDDYTLVASKTEQEIYDALDWTYCKPEDRE